MGIQDATAWLATGMSVLTLIMTISWATSSDTNESYLGGLDWSDRVFNWHPILMVSGMLVGLTNGVLSFRRPLKRKQNKFLHVMWFIAAIVCMSVGLKAVWKSHDVKPYKPNLYTLHSFIGLGAVVFLSQNFLLGLLNFVSPFLSDAIKKLYKPNHVFFGTCTLILAVMAICTGHIFERCLDHFLGFCALTGIQEKNWFLGCGYAVTEKDTNPAENYHKLQDGCKLSNGIGVCAFTTLLLTLYSLFNMSKNRGTDDPFLMGKNENSV